MHTVSPCADSATREAERTSPLPPAEKPISERSAARQPCR